MVSKRDPLRNLNFYKEHLRCKFQEIQVAELKQNEDKKLSWL